MRRAPLNERYRKRSLVPSGKPRFFRLAGSTSTSLCFSRGARVGFLSCLVADAALGLCGMSCKPPVWAPGWQTRSGKHECDDWF